MNKSLTSFTIALITCCLGTASAFAQKPKPSAQYKISSIKIVEFDENSGKFGDEVTKDSFFANDFSTSLFVTVELSGDPGYVPARNVQLTVTEGRKVKLSKLARPGILGEEGKYYIPLWLYGPICDSLKIQATVAGQTTRSTMSRTVSAHCGE